MSNLQLEIECALGLPNICGSEAAIAEAMSRPGPARLPESGIDFGRIRSAFSIALHMHQPLIPAGGGDLRTAAVISNLKYMMDNPQIGDNHNASVFHWCYKRMGEFIPQLVHDGKNPRVMLDYSGMPAARVAGHGPERRVRRPEANHAGSGVSALRWNGWGPLGAMPWRPRPRCRTSGSTCGLGSTTSRPSSAWKRCSRVRGFSPPEMALPNHPDVCYEFVKTLKDCGYRWVIVQEHSVERVEDGSGIRRPHIPHRLVARNSRGRDAQHHGHHQDPGQRHQTDRADAAVL